MYISLAMHANVYTVNIPYGARREREGQTVVDSSAAAATADVVRLQKQKLIKVIIQAFNSGRGVFLCS